MHLTCSVPLALSITLAIAGAFGCSASGDGEDATSCRLTRDCPAGQTCVDGQCRVGAMPTDAGPREEAGRDDEPDAAIGHDAGTPPDAGPCRAVSDETTLEPLPVDIIVAVDNSGSMSEEAEEVRRNMNDFADILSESDLDYRVVLLSRPDGSRGVCIPPPLGTGAPECESGPDGRLRAIHQYISSTNAPDVVLDQYDNYRDFLRPDAAKVFLWVTDDESSRHTADSFRTALEGLGPEGMFDTTIHSAIVGYYGEEPGTWSDSRSGECGSLARVGATYLRLAQCLGDDDAPIESCRTGRHARVCETDWKPIFREIAEGVLEGVPVACEFPVPEPPDHRELDLEDVRVTYGRGDGEREALEHVDAEASCHDRGWLYDDPEAPSEIVLCPDLCERVQADVDARVDVGIGCYPVLM